MFCPEGYVTFYDIANEVSEIAWQWWEARGRAIQEKEREEGKEAFIQEGGKLSSYLDLGLDDETPAHAYQVWAIGRLAFRHRNRLRVSSPAGMIMRLGGYAFEGSKVFDGDFPQSLSEQNSMLTHLAEGFFHIEDYFGTIRPCPDARTVELYGLEAELRHLAHFEGWAVCWKPDNFEKWQEELLALLHDEGQPEARQHHSLADEGRAAMEIVRLFDSNDQVTKAECRQKVCPNFGTLAFTRAWRSARSKRPGLGSGGRPKSKPQT
jgi:hypothetical protein